MTFTLEMQEQIVELKRPNTMKERYVFPPFSVLNAQSGDWQKRKRLWVNLGIKGELGRADDLMVTGKNNIYGGAWLEAQGQKKRAPSGTSIFDPVICELVYRWFCPPGGHILDPFAGGSVRGVVAAILEREYTGIDLSGEQIEANLEQAKEIGVAPNWICGDSGGVLPTLKGQEFDMIFSCPPYYNLEVYSDHPADISNAASYDCFVAAYRGIIASSVALLRNNRFACFVVGDIRDPEGFYHNFVGDTIQAFAHAGMRLYNEAILITAIGSLPIRVQASFNVGRKLGKTHQNVLVFYKGDPKEIRNHFPALEDEGTQSSLFT